MEVGIFRAPGSNQGSNRETPMSLGSPMMPRAGHAGVLKRLIEMAPPLTAFEDAMKWMQERAEKRQTKEEELPYPACQEDDPDWM